MAACLGRQSGLGLVSAGVRGRQLTGCTRRGGKASRQTAPGVKPPARKKRSSAPAWRGCSGGRRGDRGGHRRGGCGGHLGGGRAGGRGAERGAGGRHEGAAGGVEVSLGRSVMWAGGAARAASDSTGAGSWAAEAGTTRQGGLATQSTPAGTGAASTAPCGVSCPAPVRARQCFSRRCRLRTRGSHLRRHWPPAQQLRAPKRPNQLRRLMAALSFLLQAVPFGAHPAQVLFQGVTYLAGGGEKERR